MRVRARFTIPIPAKEGMTAYLAVLRWAAWALRAVRRIAPDSTVKVDQPDPVVEGETTTESEAL